MIAQDANGESNKIHFSNMVRKTEYNASIDPEIRQRDYSEN
jgi:hypothetical protein